jgi:DNA-binding response OmpR family regulator/anti-sigma regulatory factor (Ser/Thr protein kinase)
MTMPSSIDSGKTRQKTIMVVDDDPSIRKYLRANLEARDYKVLQAADGNEAVQIYEKELPDLIILDIMMPIMDGFEVCQRIREWSTVPIIMLSAREDEFDKVRALDLGADDFVVKPFSLKELLSRINAVIRGRSLIKYSKPEVCWRDIIFNFSQHKVTQGGLELELTPTEYRLLSYLMIHSDETVTSIDILRDVWGDEYSDDVSVLRSTVARLKKKLKNSESLFSFLRKRGTYSKSNISADISIYKTLCGAVVHSMKGELSNVGFSIKRLQELAGESDEALEEYNAVSRSLDYSQILLRRLLDYLNLDKPLNHPPIFILDVLRKTEALIKPRLPLNIRFETSIEAGVEREMVLGDFEQLTMVLIELVSNAINILREKGGVIDLRIGVNGNQIVIEVKDNGPGIVDSLRRNLLKRQVPSKRGLGLGLFLCNNVIKSLGGKLDVSSSLKQGTTVTMLLPKMRQVRER